MSGESDRTIRARDPSAALVATRSGWTDAFLEALAALGTVCHACKKAGVSRSTVYLRRDSDKEFAARMADAIEDATDTLEREAFRRGAEGYLEPVVYQGTIPGVWLLDGAPVEPGTPGSQFVPLTVRRYSDTVLIALLKARRYGDKVHHSADAPGEGVSYILVPVAPKNVEESLPADESPVILGAPDAG